MRGLWLVLVLFLGLRPANALDFTFPMDCVPDQTCFITASPDLDASPSIAADSQCGSQTTDGALDLEISLPNIASIQTQKNYVGAVADGTVTEIINNAPDQVRPYGVRTPAGILACGNGVMLDHTNGWTSLYCHMLQDSFLVKKGDTVLMGQVMGQVGLSGATRWPKLSLTLMRNGGVIDPLTGSTTLRQCGQPPRPVFNGVGIANLHPSLVAYGLTTQDISDDTIRAGFAPSQTTVKSTDRRLTIWLLALGVKAGDKIDVTVYDPKQTILSNSKLTIPESTDALPVLIDLTAKRSKLKIGTYQANLKLTRTGKQPYATKRSISFTLE